MEHVITDCFALESASENIQSQRFPFNQTLTIQNIESFYNYRTIENDFKLVTSVLSNESGVITLVIKNQKEIANRKYQVIPEIVIKDQFVNFSHLHGKKYRINSAFQKIKSEKEKQNKAKKDSEKINEKIRRNQRN